MKTDKDEKISSARRRLIKGGLVAAPAVVALHSGSAFAAGSNERCLANTSPTAAPGPGPTDNWVRVQLWWLRKASGTDSSPKYFIRGYDIEALRAGSSKIANSFLSSNSWVQFDLASQSVIGQVPDPSNDVKQNEVFRQDGPHVAIRVSPYSGGVEIVGVVKGQPGTPVSGTCWASFTGMKAY